MSIISQKNPKFEKLSVPICCMRSNSFIHFHNLQAHPRLQLKSSSYQHFQLLLH